MEERNYRLKGYNYSKSRFYMVTLKMHPRAAAISELDAGCRRGLRYTDFTEPFTAVILKRLPAYFHGTIQVMRFVIMPNHLHLVIWIKPVAVAQRANLTVVVAKLIDFLNEAYVLCAGGCDFSPVLPEWYDTICFTNESYRRSLRYIDQNPERALLRRGSGFCRLQAYRAKDGRIWRYYGNFHLLKSPGILAVECSRKIPPGSTLWRAWEEVARRVNPGAAGIGTFMSPCEKRVRELILEAGGGLITLLPQGITPQWHPGEALERLCAEGRVLFLTPFEAAAARPTAAELYQRCHAGGLLKELMAQVACNFKPPPRQ